jgi:voltage-gated potassium channel Kch
LAVVVVGGGLVVVVGLGDVTVVVGLGVVVAVPPVVVLDVLPGAVVVESPVVDVVNCTRPDRSDRTLPGNFDTAAKSPP